MLHVSVNDTSWHDILINLAYIAYPSGRHLALLMAQTVAFITYKIKRRSANKVTDYKESNEHEIYIDKTGKKKVILS